MDNKETIILTTIDLINKKGEQIFVKKAWGNYATPYCTITPILFPQKLNFLQYAILIVFTCF